MPVKTTLNSTFGLFNTNAESGIVIEKDASNVGFAPFKVHSTGAFTGSATVVAGDAGVTTVSGVAAVTLVMPLASATAGSDFCFRTTSAHAHILTGSQETNGTKVFSDGTNNGSRLTLTNVVGSSVWLKSDGVSYLVMGRSGSVTIAGT